MTSPNSVNAIFHCDHVDPYILILFTLFYCPCKVMCHPTVHLSDFLIVTKYPKVKLLSVPLSSTLLHNYKWTVTKNKKKKTQKNTTKDQSVKLTRLASSSEGQAFWLFEGRMGWCSCKLPKNLSQHCTVPDITIFPVLSCHTAAFDADAELHPEIVLLCYTINPVGLISVIRKKKT